MKSNPKFASIPDGINEGIRSAKQFTMLSLLGNPRSSYSSDCQPITNLALKKLIVIEDVGPFMVTGIKPAVDDLRDIFKAVESSNPDLYSSIGTAGMLCCRLVRGSNHAISNHAWGTAIDLKINGVLDNRGDNKVLESLAILAPFFNKHGWFWGAGFRTEDSMHFEVGEERIREFHAAGFFGKNIVAPDRVLNLGDRGLEVAQLQKKLNEFGASMEVDGIYGVATRAEIISFQAANGLVPDGIVGHATAASLGL